MPFQPTGLAEMGFRPAGTSTTKSPLEQILEGASNAMTAYDKGKKAKELKEKDKVDMYIALRNAGYSKDEAYDKTLKPLGWMVPSDTPGDKKSVAEIENIQAKTEETKAGTEKLKNEAANKGKNQFDNANDVPKDLAGVPLQSIKYDSETGKYEGVYTRTSSVEKPTPWDLQKEARITVNAMISQNPQLQMEAFKNPQTLTDLIDKEVARLSKQYGKGGEALPKTTPEPTASYTPEQETTIQDNMKAYGKTREEIIGAMTKKGLLK